MGAEAGILRYLLGEENNKVFAYDIVIEPLNMVREKIRFSSNVEISNAPLEKIAETNKNSFDCIVALDVLEHIDDLTSYTDLFKKLLKENGELIFSGPTENILYKIGRKIAGRDYSGDYHVSNIRTIKLLFDKHGKTEKIKSLYPILPLFEIYSFRY